MINVPYLLTGTESTVSGLEAVAGTMDVVMGVAGSVLDWVMENPLMLAYFTVGFIGIGIGIVKSFKH